MSDIKRAGYSPFLHTQITDYHDWLRDYQYRIPITLTGGLSGMQTNYQIKLTVPYDSNMQDNFNDLRFTGQGGTLIDAWLEDKTDALTADIQVEFPITPAYGENQLYYLYFGNESVANYWDISKTFLLGDNFNDGDISTGGTYPWNQIIGSTIETAGSMVFDTAYEEVETTSTATEGVWELDAKGAFTTNSRGFDWKFIWIDANNYYNFQIYRTSGGSDRANLLKVVAGVPTTLITGIPTHDTNFNIFKVTRDSSGNFEIFRDAVSLGSFTDTVHSTSNKCRLNEMYNVTETIYFNQLINYKSVVNPPTYSFGNKERY